MYKIMMFKNLPDKAEICLSHAKYIAAKYSINFNFDTDPNHYIAPADDEQSGSVNGNDEDESVFEEEAEQGE